MSQSNIPVSYTETLVDEELITGEAVSLDVRATGFALRAAGTIIDMIVAGALLFLLITLILGAAESRLIDPALLQALIIGSLVTAFVIFPLTIETLTRGRSIGKMVIGARIVRDDGGSIQFRHALIRSLVGVLELWMTSGGLAAMFGLLNPKAKRLGDLMAGTYSQYERTLDPSKQPTFTMPWELQLWAQTADAAKLPERLMRRITSFLKQAGSLTPESRERIANMLAIEVSPYVSPLPDVHPSTFLTAIVVLRRERELAALAGADARLVKLEPILRARPNQFPER
ncbi:MAG: RDD family protein [Microbacteriaceae bacterium]